MTGISGAGSDRGESAAAEDRNERLARIFPVAPECPCRDIDDCKPCHEAGYCVVDADLYRAERGLK